MVITDDVHTGDSGISRLRILWSEPLFFNASEIMIVDDDNNTVPFTVTGNNTQIMTINFTQKLIHDSYTIVIFDTAMGLSSSQPIDGDKNGAAGGDLVITMIHRKRADLDNNNRIGIEDLAIFAQQWLWQK